jgi:hypothetical protein
LVKGGGGGEGGKKFKGGGEEKTNEKWGALTVLVCLEDYVHPTLINDLLQAQPHGTDELVAVVLIVIGAAVKGLVQAQGHKGCDGAVHGLEVRRQPLGLLNQEPRAVRLHREEHFRGHHDHVKVAHIEGVENALPTLGGAVGSQGHGIPQTGAVVIKVVTDFFGEEWESVVAV